MWGSGYYTCTEQETCTPTGCVNVCNLDDKTSGLYCEKCDSCRDNVQNCGENCTDGGPKCNAGTKETDNPYQVTFDFVQPPEVIDTKMYVDADSFNCMDGTDNDKDCSQDCSDSDCGSALSCDCTDIAACADQTPPVTTITFDPPPNTKGWYIYRKQLGYQTILLLQFTGYYWNRTEWLGKTHWN